jgi:hypothetical protein
VKTQNNYKCWLSVEKLEIVVGKYIMSAVTLLPTVVVLNEEDHEKAMQSKEIRSSLPHFKFNKIKDYS